MPHTPTHQATQDTVEAARIAKASAILENVRWYRGESKTEYLHLGDFAAVLGLKGQEEALQHTLTRRGYDCPTLAFNDTNGDVDYLFEESHDQELASEVTLMPLMCVTDALGDSEHPDAAWNAWREQIVSLAHKLTGNGSPQLH